MRRRALIGGLGAASVTSVLGLGAQGQGENRPPVVGLLRAVRREIDTMFLPLTGALRDMGYEDGRNLRLLYRWADGAADRLRGLAQELVADGPDIIVTSGVLGTRAAQAATPSIPVVTLSDDLVEAGLVASMSRPGGNTTGVSILANDLDAKRLEILHACVPEARRLGILVDPSTLSSARQLDRVAGDLRLELVRFAARDRGEIEQAVREMAAAQVAAVNVLASPLLNGERGLIVSGLNQARLPAIYQWPETSVAGGLLAYGPRLVHCYQQLAGMVVKIIRGARPEGLPVEQPTKFDLVINLNTARTLGLTVPPTLLARADEVIE